MKTKVIELLYSWTLALPEESKIKDAYHMLKRQGMCLPLSLRTAQRLAEARKNEGCLLPPSYIPSSLRKTVGQAWLGVDGRCVEPACPCAYRS